MSGKYHNSKRDAFFARVEEEAFYIELSEGMDNYLDRIEWEYEHLSLPKFLAINKDSQQGEIK